MHTGDKRIISGHLDFHNYEDFGTSSTNFTRYLFEYSRRNSVSQQWLLLISILSYCFSLSTYLQAPETARQMILLLSRRNAKLSFSFIDTIRINYNHSLSVINDHIIWMADRRRYPPQQTSNVTNGSNSVLLPHVYIKQSAETLQRVQYVTTTAYYFTHCHFITKHRGCRNIMGHQ